MDVINEMNNLVQNLKVFKNEEFGQVRATTIKNEPWFVGKDIASILGYANTSDALKKHVDKEDKGVAKCDTLGGKQILTVINESGLYSLILSSKLPNAKKFKRWVTSDVLPSIRKTGGYIPHDENMSDDEIMARALLVAQKTIEEKSKLLNQAQETIEKQSEVIGEMAPKAEYFDALVDNNLLTNIRDTAKELGIKERTFTEWLIQKNLCYRDKKRKIKPYANKMKYFELKEFTTAWGHSDTQTLITPRGKETFRLLLIKDGLIKDHNKQLELGLPVNEVTKSDFYN